jgi:hypothetical protein
MNENQYIKQAEAKQISSASDKSKFKFIEKKFTSNSHQLVFCVLLDYLTGCQWLSKLFITNNAQTLQWK